MKTTVIGGLAILTMAAAVALTVIHDLDREAQAADVAPSAARALAVAQLATEQGLDQLARVPGVWTAVQNGRPPKGYDLDAAFSDEPSTRYAVRLSPGPGAGQVTITGVGQDLHAGAIRGMTVVYELAPEGSAKSVSCRWDFTPACD